MTHFTESPIPHLLLGLALESILLMVYLQTRQGLYVILMATVAALTVAGILFEQFVVTDREAVQATVYGLAAAIEADDLPAVLTFLASQATQARAAAKREMERFEIQMARVASAPKIEFFAPTSPTARVAFRAIVKLEEGGPLSHPGPYVVDFVLTLIREGDHWLVTDYAYESAR